MKKPALLLSLLAACAACSTLGGCIVVPDDHRGGHDRDYRHEHRDEERAREREYERGRDYERGREDERRY